MNTAIEFKNIKKSYGDKTVIENLNLTVEQGEFVTIVGSSGCQDDCAQDDKWTYRCRGWRYTYRR